MTNFLKPTINRKPRSYIRKNICQKDNSRLFIKNSTSQNYFKVLRGKRLWCYILFDPVEISFKNECGTKTISDIKNLKELITRRPALQEKLKKLFQVKKINKTDNSSNLYKSTRNGNYIGLCEVNFPII